MQKAAVQNYESILFQFNQLEVPSWPALKLREITSQCIRHIFSVWQKALWIFVAQLKVKRYHTPGAVKLGYSLFKLDTMH